MMRMMALRGNLYGCWEFLGFLVMGMLLVMCALVLVPYVRFEDAFRRDARSNGRKGNKNG